jgi:hypothetical protein
MHLHHRFFRAMRQHYRPGHDCGRRYGPHPHYAGRGPWGGRHGGDDVFAWGGLRGGVRLGGGLLLGLLDL